MAYDRHDSTLFCWVQFAVDLPVNDAGIRQDFCRLAEVAWLLSLSIYDSNTEPGCYFHQTALHDASLDLLSLSVNRSLTLSDLTRLLRIEPVSLTVQDAVRNTMVWHGPVWEAHGWFARYHAELLRGMLDMVLVVNDANNTLHLLFDQSQHKVQKQDPFGRIETLKTIYSALVKFPMNTLGNADFLSDHDKRRILAWNQPVPDPPLHMTIPSGFAAKVEEHPDAPAVFAWDGEMTYHELDRASSSIASLLTPMGRSGPHDMVLFNMRKSKWALVAALAISKAGKAIVPTDPSWPESRLDQIVEITGACLAVCDEETKGLFGTERVSEIVVPPASGYVSALERSSPEATCAPSDLAYVLFSSGTTGVPKGMLRQHNAACTGSFAHAKAMHLDSSRVLQFASHVFDVAMLDFFTTLLVGACVCIPSEPDRRNLNDLARFVERSRANWALLTPTVAELLDPSTVPSFVFVTLGGESLRAEATLQKWLRVCRVGINYGSAEVDVTHVRDVLKDTDVSNVGQCLPSCSAYIVDPEDPSIVLPVGAVGELVISGPTMAREYLNAPTKTARSFLATPQKWLDQGMIGPDRAPWMSRIYLMGDLFRQRSDGSLDFVSRKDFQVKVNGQKVELGDIESKLIQHPAVKQCVILYPAQGLYARRLVAVVQSVNAPTQSSRHSRAASSTKSALSLRSVTEFLSCILPPFMLPTVLMELENMPYTPTMKIDRNRLKNWLSEDDPLRASLGEISYVSTALEGPSLPPEEKVAMTLSCLVADTVATKNSSIWKSINGHDNRFSDIGIDSAQTMRLSSVIQKRFGIKIPVETLISTDMTIRRLATHVTSSETRSNERNAPDNIEARISFLKDRVAKVSESLLCSVPIRELPKRHVFLTGATGYLGVQILLHLLRSNDVASITALVRSPGLGQASEKVRHAMAAAGSTQDHDPKLYALPGDLCKPRLGLSEEHWSGLSECGQETGKDRPGIDTIIHCGAVVDWTKSYDELEAANVTSTAQLLQLALKSPHLRRFVFISGGRYPDPVQDEDHDLEAIYADTAQGSGYAQSKFVAEQLVDNVRRVTHDKSIDIVCPAYLIGSQELGLASRDDYFWRIAAAALRVGAFNADEQDQWLFVADASSVAERVVALTLQDHTSTRLKILDGLSMHNFWSTVCDVLKTSLMPVSGDVWLQKVKHDMYETSNHLLWPLAETLDISKGALTKRRCLAVDVSTDVGTTGVDIAMRRNLQHLSSGGFFS